MEWVVNTGESFCGMGGWVGGWIVRSQGARVGNVDRRGGSRRARVGSG